MKLLAEDAALFTQVAGSTNVGPVVLLPQVVDVKLLLALAATAVHDATGVGPVVVAAGHVVVVKPLAAVGPLAVHVATATLVVLFVEQVVVV